MYSAFSWFISVFVVGILINVISAYAMPHIEKYVGRFSDYQRISNQKRKDKIEEQIKKMTEDSEYVQYKLAQMNDTIVELVGSIVIFIFCIVVVNFIFTVYGVKDLLQEDLSNLKDVRFIFSFRFGGDNLSDDFYLLTIALSSVFLHLTNMAVFLMFINSGRRYFFLRTVTREYFKRKNKTDQLE